MKIKCVKFLTSHMPISEYHSPMHEKKVKPEFEYSSQNFFLGGGGGGGEAGGFGGKLESLGGSWRVWGEAGGFGGKLEGLGGNTPPIR